MIIRRAHNAGNSALTLTFFWRLNELANRPLSSLRTNFVEPTWIFGTWFKFVALDVELPVSEAALRPRSSRWFPWFFAEILFPHTGCKLTLLTIVHKCATFRAHIGSWFALLRACLEQCWLALTSFPFTIPTTIIFRGVTAAWWEDDCIPIPAAAWRRASIF